MKPYRFLTAALLLAAGSSCLSQDTTGPRLIGEGRRVLFIGNSYLYTQDIPGIVQALADSAHGDKLAVETVAGPDLALGSNSDPRALRRRTASVLRGCLPCFPGDLRQTAR